MSVDEERCSCRREWGAEPWAESAGVVQAAVQIETERGSDRYICAKKS